MKKRIFDEIVVLDMTGMLDWALGKLQLFSQKPVRIYHTFPGNNDEILDRIGTFKNEFDRFENVISTKIVW
jgi:hypothetical protein